MTLYSSFRKTGYGDLPPYVFDKTPRKHGTPSSQLYDWYIKSLGVDPTSKDVDYPELQKRFDVVNSIYSNPDLRGMALFLAGNHPIGLMDRATEAGPMERVLYALSPKIAEDNNSVTYEPQEIGSWGLEEGAQGLYDLLKSGEITPELAASLTPTYGRLNYPYMRGEDGNLTEAYTKLADRPVKSLSPTTLISRGYVPDTEIDLVDNPKIPAPTRSRKGKGEKEPEGLLEEEMTITEDPEKEKIESESEEFTESTSDLFTKMRAARRNKNSVVTDESGNVDIVKSSTSSLFKSRMRGSR